MRRNGGGRGRSRSRRRGLPRGVRRLAEDRPAARSVGAGGTRGDAQYRNPWLERAAKLNDEASATFAQGTEARQNGDDFVRDTVLFASILMLVTLASRLHIRRVRLALPSVAGVLLVFALVTVIGLPRA